MCSQPYTFFFKLYCYPRYLPVLTHSVPSRRSSDLRQGDQGSLPHRAWLAVCCQGPAALQGRPEEGQCAARRGRSQEEWRRSEEHTSELQSIMRITYVVFFLKKKIQLSYLSMNNNMNTLTKKIKHYAQTHKKI